LVRTTSSRPMSSEQSAKLKEVPIHGTFHIAVPLARRTCCGWHQWAVRSGVAASGPARAQRQSPTPTNHCLLHAGQCPSQGSQPPPWTSRHCAGSCESPAGKKGRVGNSGRTRGGGRGEQHEYGGSVTHTPKIGATTGRHQRLPTRKLVGPHAPCRCPTQRVP
jgi:hypothetical protein